MKNSGKYLFPIIVIFLSVIAAYFLLNQKKSLLQKSSHHEEESESHEHTDHDEEGSIEEEIQGISDVPKESVDPDNHTEGIVVPPSALQLSKIELLTVQSQIIKKSLSLYGTIAPNRDELAKISPRFPGIIKSLHKNLGDDVKIGDTIALVESNESLSIYSILAQLNGTIIEKNHSIGEFVDTENSLYTIVDLNSVWVEFNVHREDYFQLRLGQTVEVNWENNIPKNGGKITYVSPVGSENTQTFVARITLPNPGNKWKLGLFVKGEALLETIKVPLGVKVEALQNVEGKEVIFVKEGDRFEARPVKIGMRSKEVVEILSGLKAGDTYAGHNSFILKADLGKSEAGHEH